MSDTTASDAPVTDPPVEGAGAGAAGAGAGDASEAAATAAPPKKLKGVRRRYAKVEAAMDDFLTHYPVDRLGRAATLNYFLKKEFKRYWFVGFYMVTAAGDKLSIGPYQGDVLASGIIDFGAGVCGTAAATKETQMVADVTKCDNYIACDAETKSEIVVPVFCDGKLYAVLDIDSTSFRAFSDDDKACLEAICAKYFTDYTESEAASA